MLTEALYVLLIILEIFVLGGLAVYAVLLVYSWIKGAPYVPTQSKEIDSILKNAILAKGMHFLEVGCGDGRVTRRAVELYGVFGEGIDVNPELILRANLLSKRKNLKKISFEVKDALKADFSKADVIYIYLFPALIEKLKEKLLNETKYEALIISHGFKIPFLSHMLVREQKGSKFTTYYYQKAENIIDKSL